MESVKQTPTKKQEGTKKMSDEKDMIVSAAELADENTEPTVEQPKKIFTQKDVDEMMGKRAARIEAKVRREYEKQYAPYGELCDVLKAGTGKESVEELTDAFKEHYRSRGVLIPKKNLYSDRDIEILAAAEANDIIDAGYDEVVSETNRLAAVGIKNMTPRERVIFQRLADHRRNTERSRELSEIGVGADVSGSEEFRSFAAKFAPRTSIKEIYDIYQKTRPKKELKVPESMKNSSPEKGAVKDFYSYEEASGFTVKDFDKNPELYRAVLASMPKW